MHTRAPWLYPLLFSFGTQLAKYEIAGRRNWANRSDGDPTVIRFGIIYNGKLNNTTGPSSTPDAEEFFVELEKNQAMVSDNVILRAVRPASSRPAARSPRPSAVTTGRSGGLTQQAVDTLGHETRQPAPNRRPTLGDRNLDRHR